MRMMYVCGRVYVITVASRSLDLQMMTASIGCSNGTGNLLIGRCRKVLCQKLHLQIFRESISVLCAVDMPKKTICSDVVDADKSKKFKYAIDNHYWYELFMGEWSHPRKL